MRTANRLSILSLCLVGSAVAAPAFGQTLSAPYSTDYSATNLGTPVGVPGPLGGLTFLNDNTLLIGGNANNGSGAIYELSVTRDAQNHITGFSAPATLFATAPNIDGGLAFGPGGDLFYTAYPTNQIGELKPGSVAPDKVINLTGLGVASSVGTLAFVPAGLPGAGNLIVASYNGGGFSTMSYTSDGTGTYDLGTASAAVPVGGGPEGLVYIPSGNPDFASESMLVDEYGLGTVDAYQVDANGLPIAGTGQSFMTDLTGAEGAVIDPLTGDYLFSTFGGGNHLEEVQGFTAPTPTLPEPASMAILGIGLSGLWLVRRRRGV